MIGFDMPLIRRRIKKMMRKKYKKTIKLSDVDKIWLDYVETSVVSPLIKYGRVDIDPTLAFQIIGREIKNKPAAARLLSQGKVVKGGAIVKAENMNMDRLGVVYSIEAVQKDYKGKVIFKACPKLKKRVSNHLNNTMQYYKLVK